MTKYKGPCVQCGKMNDTQYSHKLCIACYQKFRRRKDFEPREKYTGPCVICGSYQSSSGRFIDKKCHKCYGRMRTTGNEEPYERYPGPCIVCGTMNPGSKYFANKMCRACYKRSIYIESPMKYCIECGAKTGKNARGKRCKNCRGKYRWKTDPKYRKRIKNSSKKYRNTKRGKQKGRMHVRRRRARIAKAKNTLTLAQWEMVLEKFNHKCAYCGKAKKLEMDHVIPISKGGAHSIENVVPACRSCNSSKGVKKPPKSIQTIMI